MSKYLIALALLGVLAIPIMHAESVQPPIAQTFPSIPKWMIGVTIRICTFDSDNAPKSVASGVVVEMPEGMKKDGYTFFLCAGHTLLDETLTKPKARIIVEIRSGTSRTATEAKIVCYDPRLDVGLIVIKGESPRGARLFDCPIEPGDPVMAIGFPMGMGPSMSMGFLGNRTSSENLQEGWWLASSTVYLGNSGGPIFDANRQQLIGITTAFIQHPSLGAPAGNGTLMASIPAILKFLERNKDKISKLK